MNQRAFSSLLAPVCLAFATLSTSSFALPAAADPPAPPRHATLAGTVMCGYQGWFATPDDGNQLGWVHYGFGQKDRCHIDLWPDVSGFRDDELFETPLRHADGSPAKVFSSSHPRTVARHFEWMRQHGIDGVFLQRFGTTLKDPRHRAFRDRVQNAVRAAATANGRSWAVMYDLSGLRAGEIESVVMQDWKRLKTKDLVTRDPSYQHHRGRPVVAVWGIGFNDGRGYSLEECAHLLRFLRDNPEFGGNCVMAGVPTGWRTLDRDCVTDPALHQALDRAEIISPWSVGRYATPAQAQAEVTKLHQPDSVWCREHGKDYLPVIFPGFSWHNLMTARGKPAKTDAIPRLGGDFLWSQARARIAAGSSMLYVAMFDELDEGTAIFPCTDNPPAGIPFVRPGLLAADSPSGARRLPSDHYLWLTGQIGKALRHQIPLTESQPAAR